MNHRSLLLGLLCVALSASEARGDAADAAKILDEARAALASGDHKAAAESAARAFESDPTLNAALLVRGQALLAGKDEKNAVRVLRQLMDVLEDAAPLSDPDRVLWSDARAVVVKVSKPDATLDALLDKQAAKLAGIAKKWLKKDPKAAEQAAICALKLYPTHAKALEALEKSRAGLAGNAESLLSPSMAAWTWLTTENWPFQDGILTGRVEDTAMAIRTNRKWTGEYDIIFEARLVEVYRGKGPPSFSVACPFVSDTRHVVFGYMNGTVEIYEWQSATEGNLAVKKKFADLEPKLDPNEWLTYELRMRKNELIGLVNGVEIGRQPLAADLAQGHIAIKVQFCKAEFRRFDVTRR